MTKKPGAGEIVSRVDEPTALIVDDSIEVCEALGQELRLLGYRAVAFQTSLKAVQFLQQEHRLAVALVDLFLADVDGRTLLNYIGLEHPQARRILMSGELALAHVPPRADLADGRLVKPWTSESLAELLAEAPRQAA